MILLTGNRLRISGISSAGKSQLNGYKPKDLMMMPARVALALQCRWLVDSLRDRLAQAEPDAGELHGPADLGA